ncbi:MAG: sigma-70 family RNA polymerase sigma factor [Chloracidobacterium sp.]|nr:sigma-70 family RNA polymerase sigma factor [Chloracidobacterium sp.]
MTKADPVEITRILQEWNSGSEDARERLLKYVYDELKRRARYLMSMERSDHTLQPTALVHETYLKLTDVERIAWRDRSHFYAFASQLMRHILVDHARRHAAVKRGSTPVLLSTEDIDIPLEERAGSILAIDEVLDRLAKIDARKAKIVEMRFFGGMTNEEIAKALEIGGRTVSREWQAARIWLAREFKRE